ncbi:spermatogenesis-associated protein 7 isoform X1 [Arapaima gigas]
MEASGERVPGCRSSSSDGSGAAFKVDATFGIPPSAFKAKMDKYMIHSRMVSHYKKVFSAKASVDSTVPRSIRCSVKYRDQHRKVQHKANVTQYKRLVHSVQSVYHRSNTANTHTSPTKSVKDRAPSELSAMSPSNTSFHSKLVVCPLQKKSRSRRSIDDFKDDHSFGSPNTQRQHFLQSSIISENQNMYKSFQNPVQKTYSGDLLQRHSHHFTESKPFSPRMLKSGTKSCLSKYRYYRSPQKAKVQERTANVTHQDVHHKSMHDSVNALEDERNLSVKLNDSEEPDILNYIELRPHCRKNKTNWTKFENFYSSSWEEEIMYLKFVLDVTNDILSRGLYSNSRVFDHVFDHHMEMNKHRLDKNKMHHILEVLHGDLERPVKLLTSSSEPEENDSNIPLRKPLDCKEMYKVKKDDIIKDTSALEEVQNSLVSKMQPDLQSKKSCLFPCGECTPKTMGDTKVVSNTEYDCIKYLNGVDMKDKQDCMETLQSNFANSLFLS